jgi:hypothetical protein
VLGDIPGTVERIRQVVCRLMPGYVAEEFQRMELDPSDPKAALRLLLNYALQLRNSIANAQVNELRQQQFTALARYMTQNNINLIGISTRRWIQTAVMRWSKTTLMEPMAYGDPFALLKLHDHSIIDIVLDRSACGRGRYHTLEVNAVPDILYFDFQRLKAVHMDIQTCPEQEFHNNPRFDSMFRELVTTGDRIRTPLSAQVSEAAATVRSVVFVCRFKHGNSIAKEAHQIANAIFVGEAHANRLTTHRPAAG